MSIDVAIVNIDRKEFFRPLDMGLNSEIRSIENCPSLFHLALVRILVEGHNWFGNRIALICDSGGPISPPYPSWDHIMSRMAGWRNITPDIIANLVLRRGPMLDSGTIYGGSTRELMLQLKRYIKALERELRAEKLELEDDPDYWDKHLPAALDAELSEAKAIQATLKKHLKHGGA